MPDGIRFSRILDISGDCVGPSVFEFVEFLVKADRKIRTLRIEGIIFVG